MYEHEMERLEHLALRARGGDPAAQAELRRRLMPAMPHIVRRALRPESKPTPATRRIRETARELQADTPARASADSVRFVTRVGRRIVSLICGDHNGLGLSTRPLQETVRC